MTGSRPIFRGVVNNSGDLLFDPDVRHHFAADLGETALTPGNSNESFIIDHAQVTRRVPAVLNQLGGFLWMIQISEHYVRALDFQHTFLIGPQTFVRLQIKHGSHGTGDNSPSRTMLRRSLTKAFRSQS